MNNLLFERTVQFPDPSKSGDPFNAIEDAVLGDLALRETPVRFAVTESNNGQWICDLGIHTNNDLAESIFRFRERNRVDESDFNVVMLVPTGIGAEIGGHAGDAAPAASLIASVSDCLVTHPNVLNASDMIQIPDNTLYVEGSVITRMLMGSARFRVSRANRVLVLVQTHPDEIFRNAAINSINAARAYYGLDVTEVVMISPAFKMISEFSPSGAAAGRIEGLECIWEVLDSRLGEFDAVAITSVIDLPVALLTGYYELAGEMINPWGGVEAMLTHAVSLKYDVPAAHSPMLESKEIAQLDLGVVDPRMAAEAVSTTFLQSVLKGLQRSPRIVGVESEEPGDLGVESISCLVQPAGCLGLPTLAALHQGVPVIEVCENANIMRNDIGDLGWRKNQLIRVQNYWEAAGVVACLKSGLDPYSTRRPLDSVEVTSQSVMTMVDAAS